ncbi:MAG: tetratricopeptide repeat protein, partial [Acidobacteria bacterium]|nr:tetratricopeptide repeat protein [Acidobacteriota bacterium]
MNRTAHRLVAIVLTVFVSSIGFAGPAVAQSTGMVKGKVVDGEGKPVEDAKVTISFKEGVNRTYDTKTNKRGEFIQIGLQSGNYSVTAEKQGVGTQTFDVRVRAGNPVEVNFQLTPSAAAAASGVAEALKKVFDEGVLASKAGNHDEAIAKFQEASAMLPNCFDCYYNIGFAHSQKKEYDKAEEAFKKAIEMKPDFANAYTGLATVYNAQKKFEEAAQASAKATELSGAAGGGGSAEAYYNQGVILWNGGKIPEAKKQFEEAIKIDPN